MSCHKYHFCRDKCFVATNIFLSRQNVCCDKHNFVTTNFFPRLSRQNYVCSRANIILSRQKFCPDKRFVTANVIFVGTKDVFVATKMILVAGANDSDQASLVTVYRGLPEDEESTRRTQPPPTSSMAIPRPARAPGEESTKG